MEINEELSLFTLYNKIKEETSLIILNDNKLNGSWKFVGEDLLDITKNGDSLIFKADGSALRSDIQRLDNEIGNLENSINAIDNNFINHNHNDGADLHSVDAIKLGNKPAADYALKADLKPVATSGNYNDLINKPDIATTSAAGLMSTSDKDKLDNIADNANNYTHPTYTPQNSGLYKIKVDDTGHVSEATVVTKADITGLGIPENDTDTHYTSTIIVSNSANNKEPVSNITNNSIYINHIENNNITNSLNIKGTGYTTVGTNASGDIVIYSDSITYNANHGIGLNGTTFYNSGVRSIDTGTTNGTISVNTNGTAADVAVKGLGSAAYTDSEDYAAVSHGNHVPDIAQQGDNTIFLRNDNTWQKVIPANIGAADVVHNHTSLTDVSSITGDTNQGFNITNVSSISGTDLTISGDSLYISNILPTTDDIKIGIFDEEFKEGYFEQLYVFTINGYDRSDNPLLKINSYKMTIDVDKEITISTPTVTFNGNVYAKTIYGTGDDETGININADNISILAADGLTLKGDDEISILGDIIPASGSEYNMGSSTNTFANGYFNNLYTQTINSNDFSIQNNPQDSSNKSVISFCTADTVNQETQETQEKVMLDITGNNLDMSVNINSIHIWATTIFDSNLYVDTLYGCTNDSLYIGNNILPAINTNVDIGSADDVFNNGYFKNLNILNSTKTTLKITTKYEQDEDDYEYFDTIFNISGVEDENDETNSYYRYKFRAGNDENAPCTVSINGFLDANLMLTNQLRLANNIYFHKYSQNNLRVNTDSNAAAGEYIQVDFTNKDITAPNFNLGATNKPFQSAYINDIYTTRLKNGSGNFNIIPTDLSGTAGDTDNIRRAYDTQLNDYYTYEGSQINLNCKSFIIDTTTQITDAKNQLRQGFQYFFQDAQPLTDINNTVLNVDRPIYIDNYLVGDKSLIYTLNNMKVQGRHDTNKISIISRQLRLFTCKKDTLKIDFANFYQETVNNQTVWVLRGGVIAGNENQYWDLGDSNHYFKSLYVGNSRIPASDYAEMFEWEDGNVNNEDRVGYMVTLINGKITFANENDDILGVISANPGIIGNMDDGFKRRYVKDEFERYIYQEKEIVNENGDKSVIKEKIETDIYDPTIPYQTREVRSEWDIVGLVGILCVRDDGTCKVGEYCKPFKDGIVTYTKDRYRSYNDNGDIIKIKNYKVMERTGKNVVKIFLRD